MKKSKENESGRSMLEMLGVLVLLMLLTLGGLHVWGLLRSDVITKDVTTAVMEEAVIRQHALRAKSSDTADEISREAAHDVKLTVENGIDGAMSDYFWVKTDALSEEVCDSMLKKAQEMQADENNDGKLGLIAIMNSEGQKITSCSEDKTKNVLQYLFQKEPGYHLHGLYPWWVPHEGCSERAIPNGGSVTNGVLTCRAGYYKTGYGTCNETCKPCTSNTYRAEETTTENSSCTICEEPARVNSSRTSCDCYSVGEECTDEGRKGLYDANCTCEIGRCHEEDWCEEGKRCCDDSRCCECETDEPCPTCPENKPYWNGTQCVACRTDDDCGDNEYCSDGSHTCQTACTDGKSTYNKETQTCICNEDYHGGSYNRGASSSCFRCGEGAYLNKPYWNGTQCVVCRTDDDCGDNEYCNDGFHTCQTACTDGKSTYNKEAQTCVCNEGYRGGFYNRGMSSACYKCGEGTYSNKKYWDNDLETCVGCLTDTNCDDDEHCAGAGASRFCQKVCNGFAETTCHPSCSASNHKISGNYASTTTACDNQAHKHCGNPSNASERGRCLCDINYVLREDGSCRNGCDEFSATTCTTACSASGMSATYTYASSGTSCGTHQVCNGSGTCVCDKGYELKNNVCTAVAAGWYKDTIGNSGAKQCPAGTYNGSTGATSVSSCVKCPAGTYSAAGASACTNCPAGKYSSSTGSTSCTNCPAGKYSSAGASACTNCPAGKYSSAGASACTNCPAGKYSAAGASACTNCPAGKYSAAGATSCTCCPAGQYSAAGAASCTSCPAGKYSAACASSCTNCPAGKYGPSSGLTSCTDCPVGKYSSAGASSCTSCPNGKTTSGTGATASSSCFCPAGKVILNGTCQNCPSCGTCSGQNATTFTCGANCYKDGNTCKACTGSGLKKSGTVYVCPKKCFRTFSGDKDRDGRLYGTVSGNGSSHRWNGDIAWGACQKDDFWCPGHTTTKPFTFTKTSGASSASGWVIIDKPAGLSNATSSTRWTCTGTNNAILR